MLEREDVAGAEARAPSVLFNFVLLSAVLVFTFGVGGMLSRGFSTPPKKKKQEV